MDDIPYGHQEPPTPASHFEWNARAGAFSSLDNFNKDSLSLTKQRAYLEMQQLTGWCSEMKAGILLDFIYAERPQIIVEIGVWGGKSLMPMARGIKNLGQGGHVYGIDPWLESASAEGQEGVNREWWEKKAPHQAVFEGLTTKIKEFSLEDTVTLIRKSSADAELIHHIGLLHIDGNHSEEASLLDVVKWVPEVIPGGLIVFDDMTWGVNDQVTVRKAVDWLDEHCERLQVIKDVGNEWGIWRKK